MKRKVFSSAPRKKRPNTVHTESTLWPGQRVGGEDAPIVGGREDSDTAAPMSHLIALSFNFMAADDVVQLVLLQEGLGDIRPKLATHAPLADRAPILVGAKAQETPGDCLPVLPTTQPIPTPDTQLTCGWGSDHSKSHMGPVWEGKC